MPAPGFFLLEFPGSAGKGCGSLTFLSCRNPPEQAPWLVHRRRSPPPVGWHPDRCPKHKRGRVCNSTFVGWFQCIGLHFHRCQTPKSGRLGILPEKGLCLVQNLCQRCETLCHHIRQLPFCFPRCFARPPKSQPCTCQNGPAADKT